MKKLLLGAGTLISATVPVAAVVACGSDDAAEKVTFKEVKTGSLGGGSKITPVSGDKLEYDITIPAANTSKTAFAFEDDGMHNTTATLPTATGITVEKIMKVFSIVDSKGEYEFEGKNPFQENAKLDPAYTSFNPVETANLLDGKNT